MKAETKAVWVAALRSGNYQQGQSWLRVGDQFCCLGVFCDLFGGGQWIRKGLTYIYRYQGNELSCDILPEMCYQHGFYFGDSHQLCQLNDTGNTFQQIADYIEAHY